MLQGFRPRDCSNNAHLLDCLRSDAFGRFSTMLCKGDNFCDFLINVFNTSRFREGVSCKRTEFALRGSYIFPFRVHPFLKSGKTSRKHAYIILTRLNPIYIVQLEFIQGYTSFFLFLLKNIDCGYSLEPPSRGSSDGYPQSMF